MVSIEETNNTKLQQQFKDLTKCSICTETFTDPRILPCIHTFCVKCLEDIGSKSNRNSGQNMPCPLCKREFSIPLEGFTGIQKNFFLARHIEIGTSVTLSSSSFLCDACLEDYNDPASATQVPSAEMFCTVCCLKLCRNCLKIHRKGKLTISHKLETVENQPIPGQNQSKLIHKFCKEHKSERFKMYCSDCKEIVCSFCYIESHQGHKWSDVEKASDEFCNKIQKHIQSLAFKNKGLREKREEVSQAKINILASMESLELEINQRKALLKETIDKHANLLLMEVDGLRQEKLKLAQIEEEDIDRQIANEECYSLYCQEITTKGSVGDICRDEAQLSQRAIELQELSDSICQRHLDSTNVVLQVSKLDEFLKENGQNFVGDIEETTLPTEASEFKPSNEVSFAPINTNEDLARRALESPNPREMNEVLVKHEDKVAASEASKCRVVLTKSKRITGMGIIENELFILIEMCPTVKVYSSVTFTYLRCWRLPKLNNPEDLVTSLNPKCLYIFNAIVDGQIYQVNINGSMISSWISGSTHVRLSVTPDSNVIVTYLGETKLKEYRSNAKGRLIQQLSLQASATYAVKLKTGNFVVSRGKGIDSVFEIDAYGKDKNSFKGKIGSTVERLNCPEQLAVYQHGSVFVLDRGNIRILLLNSNLEFQREVLSWKNGLHDPRAMALDYETNRLLVSDHDSAVNLWRILVINIA